MVSVFRRTIGVMGTMIARTNQMNWSVVSIVYTLYFNSISMSIIFESLSLYDKLFVFFQQPMFIIIEQSMFIVFNHQY